jgi:hypothetical protein
MVSIVDGVDATGSNFTALAAVPVSYVKAGYATGSAGVAWSAAQFGKYPGSIVIDQDVKASDVTADVLDYENGAATLADLAPWKKAAQVSYLSGKRSGQREPAVYCSLSSVTAVVNALVAGGVTGCPLWMAHYGIGRAAAVSILNASNGPFPIAGVQYSDQGGGGVYDLDVFLTSWVTTISGKKTVPVPQSPPGQWLNPAAWTWQTGVTVSGSGLDNVHHAFMFNASTGGWVKQS